MFDERTSVVIATRNRATELKRSIVELLSLDPTPQVFVVDNASTDDTAPQMRALAAGCPHVHYRRLRGNEGAAARNVGVRAVTTPYVAFADDDSWWERGALTRAADLLDAHPRLGLVAARALVGDEARPDPFNEALARGALGTPEGMPGPAVLGFLACAAVVRRSAYVEAGGFSDALHSYGEEQLLAYDLAALGWRLCYAEDVIARHQPSAERPDTAWRRAREMRNAALTSWHRRPLGVCLRDTRSLAAAALRDRSAATALAELLARLPAVLARRRRLPAELEAAIERLETAEAAPR
ncbi:glycosyltransferase family 2 protein [Glycomyces tenuis]|uniref:glycosyltransferase family 2 protein n=1 Tax=Glycomyces tenuis TaxID=58116 RepID=UPI0004248699|nr:glycosyltransferase family 2 protein [Glycomyces tenuis]